MTWQLSTYEREGSTGLAVLRADDSLAAPTELKRWPTMMELLADWEQAAGVLRGLDVADAPLVEHDRLRAGRSAGYGAVKRECARTRRRGCGGSAVSPLR